MHNQQTCGQGLAEHSVLPAKFREVIHALGENLELHMTAIDMSDPASKKEYTAYQELATTFRKIGNDLRAAARRMATYRDLPMGKHDVHSIVSPEVRGAFERFVKLEQELLALLQQNVTRHQAMLGGGRG